MNIMRKTTYNRNRMRGQAGLTLVEMIAMTGLLSFLIIALFCLFSVANHLFRAGDAAVDVEEQARLAITQIASDLKQSGYYTDPASGRAYPYIFTNATADGLFTEYTHTPAQHEAEENTPAYGPTKEVVFRLAEDVDGDGYKTDSETGKIEWGLDEISYQLRTGPDGVNQLERRVNNSAPEVVARFVERITFDDVYSDPTVSYAQVRVVIHLRRKTTDGRIIKTGHSTMVKMRNFERED